eukprot:843222-Pyramimonas_sp.AAC.1
MEAHDEKNSRGRCERFLSRHFGIWRKGGGGSVSGPLLNAIVGSSASYGGEAPPARNRRQRQQRSDPARQPITSGTCAMALAQKGRGRRR